MRGVYIDWFIVSYSLLLYLICCMMQYVYDTVVNI